MADLLAELEARMDELASVDVHAMSQTQALTHTETLLTLGHRLAAATGHALQSLDARDITVLECGRQTTSWLVEDQHLASAEARTLLWVARRLPQHPAVAAVFAAGEITHKHAQLIISCLADLPVEWRDVAGPELIDFARSHDPGLLGQLCQQLLVRTGADEDAEAAALRKHAKRYLNLDSTFDGMVRIDGMVDAAAGAIIAAALTPLMGPRPHDDRTTAQTRADALTEIAQLALNSGTLPHIGGMAAHVAITIPFDEVLNGIPKTHLSAATIDGTPITASTARMLACDAGILPAVLGSNSEVLDLGRTQRIFSPAQRKALEIAQPDGCGVEGCQIPLKYCVAHHIDFWETGGRTDLTKGVFICLFHHWLVHHTNWKIWRDPTGKIQFSKT